MDKEIQLLELLQSAMQTRGDEDEDEEKKKKKCKKRSGPTTCTDNQRKTHITVERNRRRLMNDHLAALRSLMPPMYVRRGDQASVVAGAIEFVKELEQLLLSLYAEKKSSSSSLTPAGFFFISPQFTGEGDHRVEVEASLVQGHVNLKVLSPRWPGQLVRAIAALEELRLSVQHLNVTSLSSNSMFYSLNLKMEEECRLGSADEIASSVHQIFCCINTS
ncbi:Myc-type basic helix-loop-helix (bHLH) domain-containing protein [Dioscorea alata]|uniref:Myc-type basic helix-loop-helix (BHLH) domain-containing protein n=1 Tax=Dioscorea alata TaxID=55571 RepID=A0ACB7UUN2_DIOAL|nr:Myc-type basic helix-loop-helix (bHLH) domain-containing protein [Dioscorea alata]